ncbi:MULTISPECIES: glycoside hydrolase family 16 protein [Pirellulaceae]|nr:MULTISPECIES: glycoside hydrolase family 16 protein [Pirellulaceae]
MTLRMLFCVVGIVASSVGLARAQDLPSLPPGARLTLEEDWSSEKIDAEKWYVYRKKWGDGNHGVVPENVAIETDEVHGKSRNVLVCTAHGDRYDGPVQGWWGNKTRVGGVIVSQAYFASGRFEVVLKIGTKQSHSGGPADPVKPKGCVPAIWTYGYRWVEGDSARKNAFQADVPLYNPHMPAYNMAVNEYWSELDFPEFGKSGDFNRAMYNTFLQNRHDNRFFDVADAIDGEYHTLTTEWRTQLRPLPGITDKQVVEAEGYYWIHDPAVPFSEYWGNPLKRIGPDQYSLYEGKVATHYLDGKKIAENDKWVPAMAGQLTLGVWLPSWAGPADWKTAQVRFAQVKVWQYDDEGDVRGIMKGRNPNNFAPDGTPLK